MATSSLIVLALLGFALMGTALVLMQMGNDKRLRTRVANAGGAAAAAAEQTRQRVELLPSIRVSGGSERPWLDRIRRFFNFDPELRQAYTYPVALVLGLGIIVGLIMFGRMRTFLGTPLGAVVGVMAAVLLIRTLFGMQRNRFRDALFQQIPDAMGLVVRAIRAGLPMSEALRGISREMPAPTKDEFARIVGDVAIGRPVDEAIMRLHDRTQLTEFAFLAVTLGLQSQTGGSLAETLDNLADMVRKRVMAAKRAKALAAEARMQASILIVLPFIAAVAMSFIQPGYVETYTQNPTGVRMTITGFVLMCLGIVTIRWLIKQAGKD